MQTTKATVITLDPGQELIVRFADNIEVALIGKSASEDNNAVLTLKSSNVVFLWEQNGAQLMIDPSVDASNCLEEGLRVDFV